MRWTLPLACVAAFVVGLDALAVTTALPAIGADLGADVGARQWVVTAYLIAYAVGIVPAAELGDRFGRRRVLALGLVLFSVASAGCALAGTTGPLLACRAVQGLGAATVLPLGLAILASAHPPARRGVVLGVWGAAGGLAVACGPLVGAALTALGGWPAVFWATVPVGLVCAVLVATRLPESRGEPSPPDRLGVVLLAAAVLALTWGSGPALATGVLLLAVFAAWQRRARAPLLPARILRARGFAAANGTAVLLTATINAATFVVAQFFQEAQGRSPLRAGLLLLPWTLTPLVVAPLAGALSDRLGHGRVLAAGMLAQAVGLGTFALLAGTDAGYGPLFVALLVAGVGISTALPSSASAALAPVRPSDVGRASGATTTLQRLGGSLGVALVAAVFTAHGADVTPEAFVAGFRPALAVAAGLSLIGAVTALGVRQEREPNTVGFSRTAR